MKRLSDQEQERVSELEQHLENALMNIKNTQRESPEQEALMNTIRTYQHEYRSLMGKAYTPPERPED